MKSGEGVTALMIRLLSLGEEKPKNLSLFFLLCEDTLRSRPSGSQEESPHQKLTMSGP